MANAATSLMPVRLDAHLEPAVEHPGAAFVPRPQARFEKIPGSHLLEDLPVYSSTDGKLYHLVLRSAPPQAYW